MFSKIKNYIRKNTICQKKYNKKLNQENEVDVANKKYRNIPLYTEYAMKSAQIDNSEEVLNEYIGRPFDDNWGIEDPTGKSDEKFKIVIEQIRNDILELRSKLDKE